MITNKDLSIDSENGKITLNGNKYDLGTQGEIDTAVKDVYSVMGQLGAKNLIPYPYYRESGYSSNGMTTTYDSDGVLTINKVAGSSTAFFALTYTDDNYCLKPNTKYKLLAEFDNTTQLSVFANYGDTTIAIINKKPTGKYAVNFTTPQTLQGRENLAINAAASDTETNAKVKVMIMPASDTDETYQPYAMTNKQLTEQIATKQDTLTFDTVPTENSKNPVESGGVYSAFENLILSATSETALNVSDTFQIPTNMMSKDIIVISVNRAAWCGSIVIPVSQITKGNCANGIKIVSGDGANPTTDKYAVLTISVTGLITLLYLSNWSPLYVDLKAI